MGEVSKMKLQKKYLIIAMATAMGLSGNVLAAEATTELHFGTPQNLSDAQSPDLGMAFKTKLVRLGNGALITVFGDGVNASNVVYDLKGDKERPARDIFIRTCDSFKTDCGLETNWSAPENVSGTAALTSITTDWQGDNGVPSAYYGDSDKPNISNGGSNIMVTWTDKYCDALAGDVDGTNQRTVSYVTRENREIPFSCTWARSAVVAGSGAITWNSDPIQLTDGSRDAKQDVSKVNSMGKSVVSWQEDPLGLQIGAADGPGDGASGAIASHGTDIWFTTVTNVITKTDPDTGAALAGKPGEFMAPARLTDNTTNTLSGDNRTVKDSSGNLVSADLIDGGQTAATRANTAIVGPKVVITYEETKGSEEIEFGKYIRYHNFNYTTSPVSVEKQAGCIISNPEENARRVRFVPQATPGASGLQMGIFWKEGKYDQGGPSDIMVRLLKNGVDQSNMTPAVDTVNCVTSDYTTASAVLNNTQAINISSNTETGGNLSDATEANNAENALAHRGAIVGDDLYVGYSYTSDWALANYTNQKTYDFWLRHYDGATDTWTAPRNLSNIPEEVVNGVVTYPLTVREPRFVKTPYSDDPAQNYNPEAFVIAWGTQTNVATHLEDPIDQDIYYTRSFDKGVNYEPVVKVDNPGNASRFESQLRPTPDGQTLYAVWNEESAGTVEAIASKAISGEITGDYPYIPPFVPPAADDDTSTVVAATSGGSASVFDGVLMPALIGLFMGLVGFLGLRKIQK